MVTILAQSLPIWGNSSLPDSRINPGMKTPQIDPLTERKTSMTNYKPNSLKLALGAIAMSGLMAHAMPTLKISADSNPNAGQVTLISGPLRADQSQIRIQADAELLSKLFERFNKTEKVSQNNDFYTEARGIRNTKLGYSEHHSGCAVDICSNDRFKLSESFEETDAFEWLMSHAQTFGFSLSYPRNNDKGIIYEPWHWFFR